MAQQQQHQEDTESDLPDVKTLSPPHLKRDWWVVPMLRDSSHKVLRETISEVSVANIDLIIGYMYDEPQSPVA